MMDFLKPYYTIAFAKKLAYVIYKSNWINRLPFSAYKALLKDNPWKVINFSYSEGIDYTAKDYIDAISLEEEMKYTTYTKTFFKKGKKWLSGRKQKIISFT
ncbi:hypothetical protein [Candidatus Cardinium hertigii]|uniref:Uncharacterized protein n=1 Tax=Candidatus Cardinium hertigii TaxID=247481 RepID=A0A3N2QCQ7_9BACT|nr:hypothetical protein [Candidatus Cardinium hertigii]ROT47568.1 hypothetical protein EDM02_01855 [Candidatus Cardinium hertigii]